MSVCSACGATLSALSSFCSSCGTSVPVLSNSLKPSVRPTANNEQTFFQRGQVLVTNTRFVRANETFAMAGVTSVSSLTEVPPKKWPILIVVLGGLTVLLGLQSSITAVVIGVGLAALGVWWFRSIKNVHHVRLVTASGERDALSSTDGAYIAEIVAAISQAIVHRG